MENKKKKGFTLIELLAIIVILAIIAVITVPIILNIIDNSRRGAATDSAYGYKDAVNKYYVSELSSNRELQLEGQYTVTDGVLNGNGIVNKEIPVSGDKPSSGYLNYTNNTLTTGCLTIGDYKVTFENGSVSSTEKGTCSSSEQGNGGTTQNTVSPVVYSATFNDETGERTLTPKTVTSENTLAIGDYVKLGDNDGFYVINPNRNGNVVLMSEYNISNTASDSSDSTTTGYNAQNNGIMLMSNKTELALADAYRQDTSDNYDQPAFSKEEDGYYWENCVATSSDSSYSCDTPYRNLYTNEAYGFIYDSKSNLYASMQNYKTYLEGIIGTGKITTIRPMSYSEAEAIISNSWAHNQSYWLGSEDGNGGGSVWIVGSNGNLGSIYGPDDSYCSSNCGRGVRPVIEISISNF